MPIIPQSHPPSPDAAPPSEHDAPAPVMPSSDKRLAQNNFHRPALLVFLLIVLMSAAFLVTIFLSRPKHDTARSEAASLTIAKPTTELSALFRLAELARQLQTQVLLEKSQASTNALLSDPPESSREALAIISRRKAYLRQELLAGLEPLIADLVNSQTRAQTETILRAAASAADKEARTSHKRFYEWLLDDISPISDDPAVLQGQLPALLDQFSAS